MNDIYRWKLSGQIYLFRLINGPKCYKGQYQLDFAGEGRESFRSLIKLLMGCSIGVNRSFVLKSPTCKNARLRMSNIKRYHVKSWMKMRVEVSGEDEVCINESDDIVVLSLGGERMKRFYESLSSVGINEEVVVGNICNNKDSRIVVW